MERRQWLGIEHYLELVVSNQHPLPYCTEHNFPSVLCGDHPQAFWESLPLYRYACWILSSPLSLA